MPPDAAPAAARALLVVDDDDDVGAVVERIFLGRGWRVHRARSGSDAMAVLRAGLRLDAALVDFVLPGVGGLAVVKTIRDRFPSCRIVGLTGLPAEVAQQAFSHAGADAFLAKPFELPDLIAAVEG